MFAAEYHLQNNDYREKPKSAQLPTDLRLGICKSWSLFYCSATVSDISLFTGCQCVL